ncbi:putative snapin/Pallidin/Snn1 [Helianthus anomalus]
MSDEAQYSDSGEHHTTVTDNPNSNSKASATVDDLPTEPTTTVTTADDDTNNNNNSSTSSQMANGLSYTISTIIRDFDTQAQHTSRSQDQLSSAIDRLTNELDQLLADAPSPFVMQHAAKITGVRKRVSSLNSVLKSIQRRVDNIDRLVSAGLPNNDEIASGSPAER